MPFNFTLIIYNGLLAQIFAVAASVVRFSPFSYDFVHFKNSFLIFGFLLWAASNFLLEDGQTPSEASLVPRKSYFAAQGRKPRCSMFDSLLWTAMDFLSKTECLLSRSVATRKTQIKLHRCAETDPVHLPHNLRRTVLPPPETFHLYAVQGREPKLSILK